MVVSVDLVLGNEALSVLESSLSGLDPASSSHWNHYHREFSSSSSGGNLRGLIGFGTMSPRTPLHAIGHRMMLSPWRRGVAKSQEFRSNIALTKKIARRQGRSLDLDMFRQARTLTFLENQRHGIAADTRNWVVIGDGFGVLTSHLLLKNPNARVFLINLDKTLLADLVYIRMVFPETFDQMTRLVQSREQLHSSLAPRQRGASSPRLIAIRARDQNLLSEVPADVVINVASMQEMRMVDIHGYFEAMRSVAEHREVLFYCCNREEKYHPDGTLIRFADYPWQENDDVLVDELCPWHDQFYTFRPPGYHPYDGKIVHRLIRVAPRIPGDTSC